MISFELRCAQAHAFDGWFLSATLFAGQCAAQFIACPHCGTTRGSEKFEASFPQSSSLSGSIPISGHFRAALWQMWPVIENHCEIVGSRSVAKVTKRHESAARGETISKGIYGQASSQERDIFKEKGIEFVSIPRGPIDDA
ncbi:DUF1178 family protein [Candidatus Kirkpatrickella diaphorinae]|uniref:DUF1178 family protein n=1 Tax=Candidatus Kirkpatrickella diaphorinae TaxID=2984322 RepID=UPI0038D03D15